MRDQAIGREDAEAIAISALGFIAADPELLPRFLAITGIEALVDPPGCERARLPGRRAAVHPRSRTDADAALQEPQAWRLTP